MPAYRRTGALHLASVARAERGFQEFRSAGYTLKSLSISQSNSFIIFILCGSFRTSKLRA